jgi:hypothetical protein
MVSCADPVNDMPDKPYVSARTAAEILGVSVHVVITDIEAGLRGELHTLTGSKQGDWWLVEAWELEAPRLEFQRRRLAAQRIPEPLS